MLIVRRTTVEWVLRRAVLAEPGVDAAHGRRGHGPRGRGPGRRAAPPRSSPASGSTTARCSTADVVVVATGRRSPLPAWLADAGVEVPEIVHESGLMYLSRWYQLPAGFDAPARRRSSAATSGYVKYLGVPGDGGTLSITLAVRAADTELRRRCPTPTGFDAACRHPARAGRCSSPTARSSRSAGVRPMGGLLNRLRRFVDDDGRPVVLGFHAIGDAHTCTNPLYGRGCSLALVQAVRPGRRLRRPPRRPRRPGPRLRGGCRPARSSRGSTRPSRWTTPAPTPAPTPRASAARSPATLAAVFVASEHDPVLGRGLMRMMNLLGTPADLATDPEFTARSMAVMADPDTLPDPTPRGPDPGRAARLAPVPRRLSPPEPRGTT